jgi:hypothetical protein
VIRHRDPNGLALGLVLGAGVCDSARMRNIVWAILTIVFLLVAPVLHWTLPSSEIVRVLGTDVVRQQVVVTNERGEDVTVSRDIRYINAVSPGGAPRVFRNEDTGWGWPPYFKLDSADLAARAQDAVSSEVSPRWMIITSYGWRLQWFSKFPNAVSIERAEGPDQTLIPWFNIIVWVLFLGTAGYLARRVHLFFEARAD